MSRYGYDYSFTPSRPSGWRSVLTNVLTVGTIVAVSAISGGVVALELLGSPTSVASAPVMTASNVPPAPARAARVVTPPVSQQVSAQANASAAVEQPQSPAAVAQLTAQPAAAPAPQAAPAASVASADEQAAAHVQESELTFTRGYARRRALQAAAAPSASIEVARVESQTQVGRAAIKAKPKVVARANATQDLPRTADAHPAGGVFERFDQPDKFDFARHQALAFGDTRQNRRAPPSQGGGLFSNSPGGFFHGLF